MKGEVRSYFNCGNEESAISQIEGDAEGVAGANIPEVGGKEAETVDFGRPK